MARTPTRLAGPALLTDTAATKYTVPGSTIAVIRQVHFVNQDVSARTVSLSIGADAAATELLTDYSIAAGATYDFWAYIAMEAAEILQAFADVDAKVNMTIGGDELPA